MHAWSIALWLAVAPPTTTSADALRVEPIEYAGAVPEVWRTRFAERLERGLGDDRSALAGWQVRASVALRDGDYAVTLTAQRIGTRDQVAQTGGVCDLCGEGEVAERIQIHAAKLRAQIEAATGIPPVLSLRTRPTGAQVELDGAPVGATPLELEVERGPHRLRFELPGYAVARLEVQTVPGLTVTRELDLVPLDAARPRRTPAHVAGIVLTGVGVAAVVTGAVLLALHARPVRTPCEADADGDCKQLFDTRVPGAVVISVGAVLSAVGGGLWGSQARRRNRRPR